jgi:hypothetical protein
MDMGEVADDKTAGNCGPICTLKQRVSRLCDGYIVPRTLPV